MTPRPRKSKRNSNKSNKKAQTKGQSVGKEPSLRNYRSTTARTPKGANPTSGQNDKRAKSKRIIKTGNEGRQQTIGRSKSKESGLTYAMRNQKKQETGAKKRTTKRRDKSVNKRNRSERKKSKRGKSRQKGTGSKQNSRKQLPRTGMRTFRRDNSGKITPRGGHSNYNTPNGTNSSSAKGYSSKKRGNQGNKATTPKTTSGSNGKNSRARNRFGNKRGSNKNSQKSGGGGLPVKGKFSNHRNNFKPNMKNQKKPKITELSRISEVTQERNTVFDSIEGVLNPKRGSMLVNNMIEKQKKGSGVVKSTNNFKPKSSDVKASLALVKKPAGEGPGLIFPKTWAGPVIGLIHRKIEKANPLDLNSFQVEINPKFDKAAWDLKLKDLMQGYIDKNKKQLEDRKKNQDTMAFQEKAGQLGVQSISNMGSFGGLRYGSHGRQAGLGNYGSLGMRMRNQTAPLRTNSGFRGKSFQKPNLVRTSTPNPLKGSWKQHPRAMIKPLAEMGGYLKKKIDMRVSNNSLSLSKNNPKIPATSTSFGNLNVINKIDEEPDEDGSFYMRSQKNHTIPSASPLQVPVKLTSHGRPRLSVEQGQTNSNTHQGMLVGGGREEVTSGGERGDLGDDLIPLSPGSARPRIIENVPTVKNLKNARTKSNNKGKGTKEGKASKLTSADPGRQVHLDPMQKPQVLASKGQDVQRQNQVPDSSHNEKKTETKMEEFQSSLSTNAPTLVNQFRPQFIKTHSNFSGGDFSVLTSINSTFKNEINPSLKKVIDGKWKDTSGPQQTGLGPSMNSTPLTESGLRAILKTPKSMMRINNSFLFSEIRKLENEIKTENLRTMLETNLQRLKNSSARIKSLDDSHVSYGRSKVRENLKGISQIFDRLQIQEALLQDPKFLDTMRLSQGDPQRLQFTQQKLSELLSKGNRTFGATNNSYLKDLLSDARSKLTGQRTSLNMTMRSGDEKKKKKFNQTGDLGGVMNSGQIGRKTVSNRVLDVRGEGGARMQNGVIQEDMAGETEFGVRETQRAGFRVIHEESEVDWQVSKKTKMNSSGKTKGESGLEQGQSKKTMSISGTGTDTISSSGNQKLNSNQSASDTKGYINSSLLDKTDLMAEKDSMLTYALGSVGNSLATNRTQFLETHERIPIPKPEMPMEIESSSHEPMQHPADTNNLLNSNERDLSDETDMTRLKQMMQDIEVSTPRVPGGPGESMALRALVRENADEFNTNVSDVMNITQGALKGFDSKFGNGAVEMMEMMEEDEKVQYDSPAGWESGGWNEADNPAGWESGGWSEADELERVETAKSRLQASLVGLARHENSLNTFDSMMKKMITSTNDTAGLGKLGMELSGVAGMKNPLDASLAFLKRNPLSSMENSMVGQMRWRDGGISGVSGANALKFGTNTSDHLRQILRDNLGTDQNSQMGSERRLDNEDSFAVLMEPNPSFMQSGKDYYNSHRTDSAGRSKFDSQQAGGMEDSYYHSTFVKKDEPAIGTEFLDEDNSDQDSMSYDDEPTRAVKDATLMGVDVVYPETQSGPYKLTNSSINFGNGGDSGDSREFDNDRSEYQGSTDGEEGEEDEHLDEESGDDQGTGSASFAFQSKVIHHKVISHNKQGLGFLGGTKISAEQGPHGLLSRVESDGPDDNKKTIINRFPIVTIPNSEQLSCEFMSRSRDIQIQIC